MRLFENIKYRLNEVKITGDTPDKGPSDQSSEVLRQKYKDDLAKKKGYVLNPTEKKKGMRLGDKLEKDIDDSLAKDAEKDPPFVKKAPAEATYTSASAPAVAIQLPVTKSPLSKSSQKVSLLHGAG